MRNMWRDLSDECDLSLVQNCVCLSGGCAGGEGSLELKGVGRLFILHFVSGRGLRIRNVSVTCPCFTESVSHGDLVSDECLEVAIAAQDSQAWRMGLRGRPAPWRVAVVSLLRGRDGSRLEARQSGGPVRFEAMALLKGMTPYVGRTEGAVVPLTTPDLGKLSEADKTEGFTFANSGFSLRSARPGKKFRATPFQWVR